MLLGNILDDSPLGCNAPALIRITVSAYHHEGKNKTMAIFLLKGVAETPHSYDGHL